MALFPPVILSSSHLVIISPGRLVVLILGGTVTPAASDLVIVLPDDDVASVAEKIRASGARDVQLLIDDAAGALQSADAFAQLGEVATRGGVRITVISADAQTLAAAQAAQFDVIGIDGAIAEAPVESEQFVTQVLPRAELETPVAPRSVNDADFLDELNGLPGDDDFARFDADDLADDFPESLPDDPYYPDDDLDEGYATPRRRPLGHIEDVTPTSVRMRDPLVEPRPRRPAPIARPAPERAPAGRGRAAVPARARGLYEDEDEVAPRRQGVVLPIFAGVVLALALTGLYFFLNRPIVYAWPPAGEVKTTNYDNLVIPISASPSADGSAVQAVPISAPAEVTVVGQASKQLSPAETARGTVLIINALPNPIDLPADTQFIATNATGQQVSFLIDAPATVPPAIYSQSQFGNSTQFGNIEVAISARSPGSASNVGDNSVTQLVVPGQPPIQSGDQVSMQNAAIGGGSEAEIYIVSQGDVTNTLNQALEQLYGEGIASLQRQPVTGGFALDQATINPGPQVLGDPANYQVAALDPPLGQPVADQNNPVFNLTLRSTFNALATPPDKGLESQLQSVFGTVLFQQNNGQCRDGEDFAPILNGYNWNGNELKASGASVCTPRGALSSGALAQVRAAVVGQSAANARIALDQLVQNGVIGGYQLPDDVADFPSFSPMVQVERGSGAVPSAPETDPRVPDATAVPTEATPSGAAQ